MWPLILFVIAACGRYRFEELPPPDAPTSDAYEVCAADDSVCPLACVASDPDCITTCGDGRCVGNAGELCGSCPADCKTTTEVCGNGACEPGEAPDCYADCGPSPWPAPWTAEEAELLTRINNARKNGRKCQSFAASKTAPALTYLGTLEAGAREWSWEIGHGDFINPNVPGKGCNGHTFADRFAPLTGSIRGIEARTATSPAGAVNVWDGIDSTCTVMMDKAWTRMATAVTHDAGRDVYVVVFK